MNNNLATLPCKVVLLGESGVGKTSIINRYVNNTFHQNFVPTLGSCYATKSVAFKDVDKNLKFEVWDTAGQEKYRSIAKIFYKDANVAILVYDICRKESFEELKNYWFKQIKENAPKRTVFAIVGNKSDLYEYEDVPESTVKSFAKEVDALYFQVSAKNSLGIDDVFFSVGLKMIDPNYNQNQSDSDESLTNIRLKNKIKLEPTTKEQKGNQNKKGCCK